MIVTQPFPLSVRQNRPIDDSVALELLIGARSNLNPRCLVKAEVVLPQSRKNNKVGLDGGEVTMSERKAFFHSLKFLTGTRLKTVRLRFTTQVRWTDPKGSQRSIAVISEPTEQTIVKTNENQWWEAEGILLKKKLFGGGDISWPRLANTVQSYFLFSTRQNTLHPTRPLTGHDLQYLYEQKFDRKPMVSLGSFEQFWLW